MPCVAAPYHGFPAWWMPCAAVPCRTLLQPPLAARGRRSVHAVPCRALMSRAQSVAETADEDHKGDAVARVRDLFRRSVQDYLCA